LGLPGRFKEAEMLTDYLRRACVAVMCLSLLSVAMPPPAQAGMVTTDRAVSLEMRGAYVDRIAAGLARDELRSSMAALGVDPADVEARLAALTDTELAELAGRIDAAPAGGDVLAIVGIVFLVLLLLEYTGTIDIFKKVP
jgi:hypothetical protein